VIGADAERRFTVHNTGNVALRAVRLRLEGEHGADFHLATSMCGDPKELAVNQSCEGMVRFVPEEPGEHGATLAVYAGPARLGSAQLTGAARPKPLPHIEISPNPMEFDKVRDAYVVIRNTGTGKLALNGFSLEDKSQSFTLEPLECQNASPLDAGESCRVHVIFKGKTTAIAIVTVNHDDMNGTKKIVLFANVPNSIRNKILTGLLLGGGIVALVASQGAGAPPRPPAPIGQPRIPAPAPNPARAAVLTLQPGPCNTP
jgi:hypothetical protein